MTLLPRSIRFVPASDGSWLAVHPEKSGAWRLNPRTVLLAQALQGHQTMEAAHEAFELAASERVDYRVFQRNAREVSSALETQRSTIREQLTFGFTLLPAHWFGRIAHLFAGLVRPGWLVAAFALLPLLSWACLRDASLAGSLGAYRQGFVGLGIIVASVVFHEIGHAAALVHHGRSVGHLGAGVNLIFPALFTEVLEHAAMDRHERAWLNIAGIQFQLLFGHAVALGGLLSANVELRHFAVVVYLLAVFQLLPLNRQDGAWLVADLLGQRRRAFQAWMEALSIALASGLATLMVVRVLVPYWGAQVVMLRYGAEFFAGGASRHASGLVGTVIVMAWGMRVARNLLSLRGRRRAARFLPRHSIKEQHR